VTTRERLKVPAIFRPQAIQPPGDSDQACFTQHVNSPGERCGGYPVRWFDDRAFQRWRPSVFKLIKARWWILSTLQSRS